MFPSIARKTEENSSRDSIRIITNQANIGQKESYILANKANSSVASPY